MPERAFGHVLQPLQTSLSAGAYCVVLYDLGNMTGPDTCYINH